VGGAEFGRLIDRRLNELGWSSGRLSVALGILANGKHIDSAQVRRLRRGEQRHITRELLELLVGVLGLDQAEAYHAAGMLPPGVSVEQVRRLVGKASSGAGQSGTQRNECPSPGRRPLATAA